MRPHSTIAWRNLTAHPLRSLLTALAIALGVGMVLAAAIVGQAAGKSAAELSGEGPQIDLEVFSRDGSFDYAQDRPFDAAVLDTLRACPDVERVSPSLRIEVIGVAGAGLLTVPLLGVDPETYQATHKPELADGAFLDRPDAIVLPMAIAVQNRLNVGDEVVLEMDGHLTTLIVSGRLKLEQNMPALIEETAAYVPLRVAQTLWIYENPKGPPQPIDRVEVALRPHANIDRVRADLAEQIGAGLAIARVATGGGVTLTDRMVQVGLAMAGAIMLFAAAFVILNAFAISVTARAREIGALRALGMTRNQVMNAVLVEALLLGLAGAALGLLAGLGLAWGAMRALGTLDAPQATFVVPWWGIVLSVGMGLGVTLVGALQPARRASRVSPLVAIRQQSVEAESSWYMQYGGRAGLVTLVILLATLATVALLLRPNFYISMGLIGLGTAGLLIATVLMLPALVNPVAWLARPFLLRWLGAAGRLAADNLSRNKLRSALTAGALTAALTTIIATSGLFPLLLKGGLTGFLGLLNEDILVGHDIGALIASGEWSLDNAYEKMSQLTLDPSVLQALEPLVKAGAVEIERIGFAPVPPELNALPGGPGVFVDPEIFLRIGNFDFFEGDPETALAWMQRGRAVLLPPIPAERLSVSVGDTIPVQTPHGELEYTVAGIGGNGYGFSVFPYADGEAYFDLAGTTWVGLVVSDGQSVDTVMAQVTAAIEPFEGIAAQDVETAPGTFFELLGQLQMLLNVLLLLAAVVASLGVVNTMVINVAERQREIALLRAVGATQRQVRQAVMAEAAVLGLMAALIGAATSALMLGIFVLVMTPGGTSSMGFRVSWELAAEVLPIGLRGMSIGAALSLIFGPLVAALAAYYPARQAAAMNVVEATRSEQVTLKRAKVRRTSQVRRTSLAWTLAWRNLTQHRLRTGLSALAVALGVTMIIAAGVAGEGFRSGFESDESQQAFAFMFDSFELGLNVVGVVILIAAGFLIFNAFSMSITQRQRQIGALRALGMTGRQVMRLVLVEALLTGGFGALLGLLTGPLVGKGLLVLVRSAGFETGDGRVTLVNVVLAVALGVGVTLVSVLMPARRATRISPLVALFQASASVNIQSTNPQSLLVGLLLIVALASYLVIAPPGEWTLPPWSARMPLLLSLSWMAALLTLLPALVGALGRLARGLLSRLFGASGRLMADNLGRDRRRVTLTILTLVIGLTVIVSLTGVLTFTLKVLFRHVAEGMFTQPRWNIYPNLTEAEPTLDTFAVKPEVIEEVSRIAQGQAKVGGYYYVFAPEISAMVTNFPSLMAGPDILMGPGGFAFTQGDEKTARSIMEDGCGLLLPPGVAARNEVDVGDTLTLQGAEGPVGCTVAGTGSGGFFYPTSFISLAAKDDFTVGATPSILHVVALPNTDAGVLEADLMALQERHGLDADVRPLEDELDGLASIDMFIAFLNSLLLLAVVAAALGVVNTTMMSVAERRPELGLLRAVGATRRQVSQVVMGEAALMGLVGGVFGLVAGVGVSVIFAVSYGGNSYGVANLPLWPAAWEATQPALLNGALGVLAAPLISAAAAWLPVRSVLRSPAVEMVGHSCVP